MTVDWVKLRQSWLLGMSVAGAVGALSVAVLAKLGFATISPNDRITNVEVLSRATAVNVDSLAGDVDSLRIAIASLDSTTLARDVDTRRMVARLDSIQRMGIGERTELRLYLEGLARMACQGDEAPQARLAGLPCNRLLNR